jgi:hypothetical protein
MDTDYWKRNTYGGVYRGLSSDWPPWAVQMYRYVFAGTSMPPDAPVTGAAYPACGTFWVDAAEIRWRPKADYILIRDRLIEWSEQVSGRKKSGPRKDLGTIPDLPVWDARDNPAYYCGRIAEYTWALMLARKVVVEDAPEFVNRTSVIASP